MNLSYTFNPTLGKCRLLPKWVQKVKTRAAIRMLIGILAKVDDTRWKDTIDASK
jgi:hypothetical protein